MPRNSRKLAVGFHHGTVSNPVKRPGYHTLCILTIVANAAMTHSMPAQTTQTALAGIPRVVIPSSSQTYNPVRPAAVAVRSLYPWRMHVTATVFWIGEPASERNPVSNRVSSWDQKWTSNYGGCDDPEPTSRITDSIAGDFRPKAFTPKLNPFYVALPYNDCVGTQAHKPEAARVIPWFTRLNPPPGQTVCKDRWLQIYFQGRSCYAQWEDCGPWVTDDWEYVFGNKPPKNPVNGSAGIDVAPAVRDYLSLKSGDKVHWRFVEDYQVPSGPWIKYGTRPAAPVATDLEARRKYLEYLRILRDEQYRHKSLLELQR